jgi:hypothetical protein
VTAVVLALLVPQLSASSGATVGYSAVTSSAVDPWRSGELVRSRPCSAHKAVRFYSRRLNEHRAKMGAAARLKIQALHGCPRYLARVLQRKARAWRLRSERWLTLRDFDVRPGYSGWRYAVDEVQRAYPGTKAWLLSCSASEGGWGRFVWNTQGSGCGGWLQYVPSTFAGFFARAQVDARRRGFRVPRSAASLFSPLGQALAGAWAYRNGLSYHWFGRGC